MSNSGNLPPKRLGGIESLRAYAAVAIVLFHLVWVGNAQPPKSLEFVKWNGGFGVQLFFVVSAFSLAYGYWGRLGSENNLKSYFLRRFARIAPLYYAVFAFQLVNVYLTSGTTYSLLDIALCAVFVFNFVPNLVDGIVPASWSIGVEMVFYLVFPFAMLLCRTWWATFLLLVVSGVVATRFAMDMAAVSASIPSYVSHSIVAMFPFFCWGILAFHTHRTIEKWAFVKRHRRRASWTLVLAAVALLVMIIGNSDLYQFFWKRGLRSTWDALWGIPFALLCIGLAIHPTRFVSNALTRYLGKVSYSLYLIHPAAVYYSGRTGLYRAIYDRLAGYELAAFTACAVLTVAMVAALSAISFRYIESPGMRWGKRVAGGG